LSPALAALLLKPRDEKHDAFQRAIDFAFGGFFRQFNRAFAFIAGKYGTGVQTAAAWRRGILTLFVVLLACTWLMFRAVPGGFIPVQDKQYLLGIVQLPDAASLDRTEAVVRQMSEIALRTPGVEHAVGFPGLSANGFVNLDKSAVMFFPLDDFDKRTSANLSASAINKSLSRQFNAITDAQILVVPPPPVQGLGTTGGFKLYVQDRAGNGYDALAAVIDDVLADARKQPELIGRATYTSFQNTVPQQYVDVDRIKAKRQGLLISDVFSTLQAYLGSTYVNDFNRFGRTFRVYAQADAEFRASINDVTGLKMRNADGNVAPLGSVATVRESTGPDRVTHYNVYLAADINSQAAPGFSSGQAIAAMERVLTKLPNGYGYEWTELTFQQKSGSSFAPVVFALCVLLVFLILSAQYESWSLPLAIILVVPMCLLSSMVGVWLVGSDNNILTQIGFIVLVGLACKNAILIVEFARERVEGGMGIVEAAVEACRLRLRPILMTSFAFIMGVVPLVLAHGAGAEMRQAMGIAVFSGMLGVTLFGLFLTPVFFVTIETFTKRRRESRPSAVADTAPEHV
ncbi:MAG TPA: efflux RND transporter permease subunit, partial [Pseudomonadales bacterium]|nr:efflux RND transporter permease subunit [Pseudomonadales bacterium]